MSMVSDYQTALDSACSEKHDLTLELESLSCWSGYKNDTGHHDDHGHDDHGHAETTPDPGHRLLLARDGIETLRENRWDERWLPLRGLGRSLSDHAAEDTHAEDAHGAHGDPCSGSAHFGLHWYHAME